MVLATDTYWGLFKQVHAVGGDGLIELRPEDKQFAEFLDKATAYYREDIDDFVGLAAAAGPESVLELFSAGGRLFFPLAQQARAVVGVENLAGFTELLEERLRGAAKDLPGASLCVDDVLNLDLDRRFSLIVLGSLGLARVPPGDYAGLTRTVERHLSNGGSFAFDYLQGREALENLSGRLYVSPDFSAGLAASVYGQQLSADGKSVLSNFFIPAADGAPALLGWRRLHVVNAQELEKALDQNDLVIAERKTNSIGPADLGLTRSFVRCIRKTDNRYPLWHPYLPMNDISERATVLVRGSGCKVYDQSGKEYIDASAGLWSTQCGQGNEEIIRAIDDQLRRFSYGTLFANRSNEPAIELARQLVRLAPSPLARAYLTNSGSESVELAIKLARLFFHVRGDYERKDIVFLNASYHGTFFGSMGVTGLYDRKERFGPLLPGLIGIAAPRHHAGPASTNFVEYSLQCAAELEGVIKGQKGTVAGFILEPIFGSAGVIVPPPQYFTEIQKICKAHDVLLIVDEVATGFGRTGKWFACEHFGLRPDIMLLSKGINSGYLPLGAVLFSEEIGQTLLRKYSGIGHGSSHNGNPACCASGLAAMRVIETEDLVNNAARMGQYFFDRLTPLRSLPIVKDITGLGLMIGVHLKAPNDAHAALPAAQLMAVCKAIENQGVLAYPLASCIALMPPLVISKDEVDFIVDVLRRVLTEAAGEL